MIIGKYRLDIFKFLNFICWVAIFWLLISGAYDYMNAVDEEMVTYGNYIDNTNNPTEIGYKEYKEMK